MAPITQASDESNHQELMDKLDIYSIRKPFRKQSSKPAGRRNKNLRQIVAEASRREMPAGTQDNSGASTPMLGATDTGDSTPIPTQQPKPNMAQASRDLAAYAQEKNAQNSFPASAPVVPYTNIEAAPSLHPSSQRRYCDITGLPASYTDPKTRLRYHNGEIFGAVRALGQASTEGYLSARGAQIILK